MQQDSQWTGKTVIVTGGGGGMGQAAAKRFADAGATTFVLGRTLDSLQESANMSERITPIVCDVADSASVAEALATILQHGCPDVLVHTTPLNSWDCGSPLFNRKGQALGLNIAAVSPGRSYSLLPKDIKAAIARMLSNSRPF